MTICDRIAVLDHGVVQQVGTPLELYDRPANRFVAQFVGSVNLFMHEGREAAFRPHAVSFGDVPGDALRLQGVVEGSEFLGEFVRYEVRVGESTLLADLPHRRGSAPFAPGAPLKLAVPLDEIRWI